MTIQPPRKAQPITVKHGYIDHAYNELTPTEKWFSLPVTLWHAVNLKDRTNCAYNEVKSSVPKGSF